MADNDAASSRSARQLKSLVLAIVVSGAIVSSAPVIQRLLGLPPFTMRARLISSAIAFVTAVPGFWVAFSRRSDVTARAAAIVITIFAAVFAFIFWRYH
jgi:hypothetical protein